MMSTKKYRIRLTTDEQQELKRLGLMRSGCGVQTDPCAHSADER